ncbi:MAG TPA: non-canonical purine NTP pyrophosphatase, RdgB/HAM1 family [Cytophagales bacterium]|nr:non-canonical purine NTP pyrophosphatase, RdgB/HAM1 family [Cytophagales bacterium]
MTLCLATRNAHKLEEIRAKLGNRFRLISLNDVGCTEELPETTDTIPGNSLQKAQYVFQHYRVSCVADDSGLEIDALAGAPGVHSAYYAGPQRSHEDNIQKVLGEMQNTTQRSAQFRTVLTLVTANGIQVFEGILRGDILHEPRGKNGFGYDPIFQPDGIDLSLAQLSLEEKNKISHRARAIEKLVSYFQTNSL